MADAVFVPLALKPGVYRNGTQYQAKGRWYSANLVRFTEGTIRPWLGWNAHSASTITGLARAMMVWQDPVNLLWIAVAAPTKVYVYSRSGGQSDITPAGLTAGRADAILSAGYGGGAYGSSTYGDSHAGSTNLVDATVWTLDTLEGLLIGANSDDGKLYSWDNNTGDVMTQPAGSPTSNSACFVTDEGFVFCLGAGGDPRKVQWADQGSLTSWTPSTTSFAGSYSVATPGRLMCGTRMAGANIIFASTDIHLATFQGLPEGYTFKQVGTGCGIISRAAYAKAEGFVAWMSLTGFWMYNGETTPIACDVQDDVFKNMNVLQRSKIWALHNATYGEIIWFYPRGTATEITDYVIWNYRENHWTNGQLARSCGFEAGVFQWPLMVSAITGGIVYQHENGLSYSGGTTPYLESGPLEIGTGLQVYDIVAIEPDCTTLGDVTGQFYSRYHSTDTDIVSPSFSAANPTDVRASGREHRLRLTSASNSDWRVGIWRLSVRVSGQR